MSRRAGFLQRTGAVLKLAIPATAELLLNMVVDMVNTYLVGHLGAAPLAAVGLGVQGAAIGSLAGRLAGGLLVVVLLLRGRSGLALRLRGWRIDPALIWRMLRIGLPAGLDQLIFRLGMLVFVRMVAALGTAAYAAHQVALSAESLSFMPGFGFAVAATTLVGQGLGARDEQRAEQDGFAAFCLAAGLMSVMGLGFILFAEDLVGIFTTDAQVIALGITPLRLIGLVQPFLAAMMVFAGGLRGAGDTVAPLLINASAVWLVRVPAALLLTQVVEWELTGAWIAMALDLVVRGGLLFTRFRSGQWKRARV